MKVRVDGREMLSKSKFIEELRKDIGKLVSVQIDRESTVNSFTDELGILHQVPTSCITVATIRYVSKGGGWSCRPVKRKK